MCLKDSLLVKVRERVHCPGLIRTLVYNIVFLVAAEVILVLLIVDGMKSLHFFLSQIQQLSTQFHLILETPVFV